MPCPSGQAHELEWKLAVGSNASVLSFLGFLCKGLAPSFSNTKSTPLVSWFPFFLCGQHQRRQNEKEQNKKLARRVPGYPGFLILNACILCIYFCVARLSEGLNFLNQ